MHGRFKKIILLVCLAGLVFSTSTSFGWLDPSPIPQRTAIQIQNYIAHEWWLLTWAEDELACKVFTEYDGLPALSDVRMSCAGEVYQTWVEQPVCEAASDGGDVSDCQGYYLYYIGAYQAERQVVVELPPASVSIFISGCQATGAAVCVEIPALRLVGQEPLTDQHITRVHYRWRGTERECGAALCDVPLSKTKTQGEIITFWADSSFGDSSEKFEALVRMLPSESGWQVDILSSQWTGEQPAALALDWQVMPTIGEASDWLGHSASAAELASQEPFQYLAGRLIEHGVADASVCADHGLLFGGYASTCGLEQAAGQLVEWQNRFDEKIYLVAQPNRLSPQLLKNIIAQESQFWPGEYAISPHEYGLGRLTQEGADTLLMWNHDFYTKFCPQVLSERTCAANFTALEPGYQAMLRGALIAKIDGTCAECQFGIDLGRASFSIEIIAASLLANGRQVGQMVTNLTGEKAGQYSSYEDLWRFTLVNYNAGAGCLGEALAATLAGASPLDWQNVSGHLAGDCRDAIGYVENVTRDRR